MLQTGGKKILYFFSYQLISRLRPTYQALPLSTTLLQIKCKYPVQQKEKANSRADVGVSNGRSLWSWS